MEGQVVGAFYLWYSVEVKGPKHHNESLTKEEEVRVSELGLNSSFSGFFCCLSCQLSKKKTATTLQETLGGLEGPLKTYVHFSNFKEAYMLSHQTNHRFCCGSAWW